MTTIEIQRAIPDVAILRAAADDDVSPIGVLHGHAARFDEWTEIDSWVEGHFLERIAPGAFRKTLREARSRIRCLFRHGFDPQIGDKVLGAFSTLREDGDGLYYEVPLYDTSFNRDLAPGLADGQYGASFRGRVHKEVVDKAPKRSRTNPQGIAERTITEIGLTELGPCTFGAYAGASSSLRSLDDVFAELQRDPDLLEQFLARAHDLRTSGESRAVTDDTRDADEAADATAEPTAGHSDGPNFQPRRLALMRHVATLS